MAQSPNSDSLQSPFRPEASDSMARPPALLTPFEPSPEPPFWIHLTDSILSKKLPAFALQATAAPQWRPDLLSPLYQTRGIGSHAPRPVGPDVPVSLVILCVFLVTGLLRVVDFVRFRTFFKSFFSGRPVDDLMRDKFLFPGMPILFIVFGLVAGLAFVFPSAAFRDGFSARFFLGRGFLAGAAIVVFVLLKHSLIRFWGALMDHSTMAVRHVLYSAQGVVVMGSGGLFWMALALVELSPSNSLLLDGQLILLLAPAWTIGRFLASEKKPNLLYNLYYLCTLEILPLLAVRASAVSFPQIWPHL